MFKYEQEIILLLQENLNGYLGRSIFNCDIGLQGIAESGFLPTDRNGLWEYCPYLCCTGLVEALKIQTEFGLALMDRHPEPFAICHLYNFLYKKGYAEDIPVLGIRNHILAEELFPAKEVLDVSADFYKIWKRRLGLLSILGHENLRRASCKRGY